MMFKKTPALFAIWILMVATFGPIGSVSADEEPSVVSGKSICFQPGVGVVAVADKTDNSICVACTDESGKVECLVDNFELPQDPKTDWDDPGGWISGYTDPSYLLYYEAFPEGEEAAWQFPGNEMLYAGLIINGVLTVLHIGPIAKGLKSIAGPAIEAGKKGVAKTAQLAAKSATVALLSAAKKRIGSALTKKIVEEATEGIAEPVLKKRAGKMTELIWYSMTRGADDVGVSVGDDAVRESVEAIEKSSVGKSVAEMTDDDAVRFTDDIVDGDGTINALMRGGAGFSKAEAKAFVKFQRGEYADAVGYTAKRLNGLPASTRKEIISRSWKTAATVWQKSPAARGWAMSVYDMTIGSDSVDDAVSMDSEFLLNMKNFADMTVKAGMVVSNPRAATKTGTAIKIAGIFALAGASIGAELADEVLMKYNPEAGINGMALSMPFYPAQTMQLGDEAHKYYVQLMKDKGTFSDEGIGSQDPQRFFLAAPCKADLIIKTSTKACARMGADNSEKSTLFSDDDIDKEQMQWEYLTVPGTALVEISKIMTPEGKTDPEPGEIITKDFKAVKYCNTETFWSEHFVKDSTHLPAIPTINIRASMPKEDNNFCYEGSHTLKNVLYGAVTLLEIGLTIGTGPVGMAVVGTAGVFATAAIDDSKMWPNHN